MPTAPADVAHLLRRAGFGASPGQVAVFSGMERDQIVDTLLDVGAAPSSTPPAILTDPAKADWERMEGLVKWWLDLMASDSRPLLEKMTLFWHGHFTSEQRKVNQAGLMHRQNALLRRNALGDFRTLAKEAALDPAMLRYLDNGTNRKGTPQENWARELWELMMLGPGNYTQGDVRESARAWTGHNLDADRLELPVLPRAPRHRQQDDPRPDGGVGRRPGDRPDPRRPGLGADLRPLRGPQAVVLPGLPRRPTTRWSTGWPTPSRARGGASGRWCGPSSCTRSSGRTGPATRWCARRWSSWWPPCAPSGWTAATVNAQWWMANMGQELFNPPNVSGWRGGSSYISTTAFWARSSFARNVTWKARDAGVLAGTGDMAAPAAVQAAFDRFGIDRPDAHTRGVLEGWVRAQQAAGRWAIQPNLITLGLLTPEFQLA